MILTTRAVCIASPPAAVLENIVPWIEGKGFELRGEIPQWRCDDIYERSLFIFSKGKWSVVLYSGMDDNLDEDNRFIIELARFDQPILYLWSLRLGGQWGYRIHEGRDVLDAYNSNPRDYDPEWLTEHPGYGDTKYLIDTMELDARPRTLEMVKRSLVLRRADRFPRFCDALGLAPASLGYALAECRFVDQPVEGTFDGWSVQRLYFVKRGYAPSTRKLQLRELGVRPAARSGLGWSMIADEAAAQFAHMRNLFIAIGMLTWVLGLIFNAIVRAAMATHWLYEKFGLARPAAHRDAFITALEARAPEEWKVKDNVVTSEIHDCRVNLPPQCAVVQQSGALVIAHKRKSFLVCDVVRPDAQTHILRAFRPPQSVEITHDENFCAGGFDARQITWKLEMQPHDQFITYWLIQTPRAFFEFTLMMCDAKRAEAVTPLGRQIVESFRLDQTQ
jgi:hypothetical protein